ncbi:MAG: hypothetical protein ABIU54_00305 [Candidatus Eisenbacteria bacterium]
MPTTTRRARTTSSRSTKRASATPPVLELVRLSRVAAAQKRIATGYYDRDEVRDRLAEAVLEVIQPD